MANIQKHLQDQYLELDTRNFWLTYKTCKILIEFDYEATDEMREQFTDIYGTVNALETDIEVNILSIHLTDLDGESPQPITGGKIFINAIEAMLVNAITNQPILV